MKSLRRILMDSVVIIVLVATTIYIYQVHGETISTYFFGEQWETMTVGDVTLRISIADEPAERTEGLSEVTSLGELSGKLFIFDESDYHGMWMKDMRIPIDIIWIDETLTVVHIEQNVTPDTYPAVFSPSVPARFVLETNAYFTDQYAVKVGDEVFIAAADLPADIRERVLY